MDKPASTRQLKVGRELQRDLAEIIRSKGMTAFGGAMVTVSEVRVSPDLSMAKVYVSIFPSDKAASVLPLLEENKRIIRGELGRKVASQLRIVPEIEFYLDSTLDYASIMNTQGRFPMGIGKFVDNILRDHFRQYGAQYTEQIENAKKVRL